MNATYTVPNITELAKTRKYILDMKARKTAYLTKMSLRLVSEDIARLMESAAQEGVGEVFVSHPKLCATYRGRELGLLRRLSSWAKDDPATWEEYVEILELDLGSEASYENSERNLFEYVYSYESAAYNRVMEELVPAYLAAGYKIDRDGGEEDGEEGFYISGW